MRRTILAIHPGAIGDVLLAVPALRGLRTAYPHCDLGLLAQGEVSRLLLVCGEVQAIFPTESQSLSSMLSGAESVRPELQHWLERCDLAICWTADADSILRVELMKAGVRHVIAQSALSSPCVAVHQEDRLLETIKDVAPGIVDGTPLVLPKVVVEAGRTRLRTLGVIVGCPVVVVHPGSGSRHKCGDPALCVEVVSWCQDRDMMSVLVGGPADDDALSRVAALCKSVPPVLQGDDLVSIAGALAHASLFVGYDSGLTHLAVRLHRSTVALFGPTDPRRWSPRSVGVTVLTGETCRCEGWESIRTCSEKSCLRIHPETIIRACDHMLTRRDGHSTMTDRLVMSKDLC